MGFADHLAIFPHITCPLGSGATTLQTIAAIFSSYKRRTTVDEPLARQSFSCTAISWTSPFIDSDTQVGVPIGRVISSSRLRQRLFYHPALGEFSAE